MASFLSKLLCFFCYCVSSDPSIELDYELSYAPTSPVQREPSDHDSTASGTSQGYFRAQAFRTNAESHNLLRELEIADSDE